MKRSQKDRLLGHMRREWITPLDALRLVGCLSLSQRVGEMRRAGIPIDDKWEYVPSRCSRGYAIVKAYRVLPGGAK